MRQQGMFSNRYLLKKGKENINNINNTHGDETDFPLAYTSTKYISRQKSPIASFKKKEEKKTEIIQQLPKNEHQKDDLVAKLQKELKETKDQVKKLTKEKLSKTSKQENTLNQLKAQLQSKEDKILSLSGDLKKQNKKVKEQHFLIARYRQTIKEQIYWLLKFFVNLQSKKMSIQDVKNEISSNYKGFLPYIQELNIQKELQELASTASMNQSSFNHNSQLLFPINSSKVNMDSMFTEEYEDNHLVKIMELQPLIQTFNNNQNCLEEPLQHDKIAKRLFQDSPLFKDPKQLQVVSKISLASQDNSIDYSRADQNEFLNVEKPNLELPREVLIIKNFQPQGVDQNYISLKKGETLKLLRKIRQNLWIGEYGQKIGLVQEAYFQMH